MLIKPIETKYAGCRFRSRLEARWAVFFNTVGINWEYEPEGFMLPSGRWYLPDFKLHLKQYDLWVEVKPTGGDISLFEEFMRNAPYYYNGTVLREIPSDVTLSNYGNYYDYSSPEPERYCGGNGEEEGDRHDRFYFCICPVCLSTAFVYNGGFDLIECGCFKDDTLETHNHPIIREAFYSARNERFGGR